MRYVCLDVPRVTSLEYMRIDVEIRGLHAALLARCAERENSGVLAGARAFTGPQWRIFAGAGVSERVVADLVKHGLATWAGDDLHVHDYDHEGELQYQRKRAIARGPRGPRKKTLTGQGELALGTMPGVFAGAPTAPVGNTVDNPVGNQPESARDHGGPVLQNTLREENGIITDGAEPKTTPDDPRVIPGSSWDHPGVISRPPETAESLPFSQAHATHDPDPDPEKKDPERAVASFAPFRADHPTFDSEALPGVLSDHPPQDDHRTENVAPRTGQRPPDERPAKSLPSDRAYAVADRLRAVIFCHTPTFVLSKGARDRWAADLDLAIRIDKRAPERLEQLAEFAHADPAAWTAHGVLSGKKLRALYDELDIKERQAARRAGGPRRPSSRGPSSIDYFAAADSLAAARKG